MEPEEKKFLDLDMVAEHILHAGDRDMFREAVKCYHIGSHRAAVILVWIATAECLKRRVEELATEGDPLAQDAWQILQQVDGESKFEQNLIDQSRSCELLDDFDHQCITFARNTRSKCAHPGGIIPTAEAVRHILQICSQRVLRRTDYRGRAFIKEVVTTRFDSPFFLPPEGSARERCVSIIDRVPQRLWAQFTAVAASERPKAASGTWRKNSLSFFSALLEKASDDSVAQDIAAGMKGFQTEAPEYFAMLVGLDQRVSRFWDKAEREEARARLANASLTKVSPEMVRSWAHLCTEDGFEPGDLELLTKRIGILSRHFPDGFLTARRAELYKLLADMAEKDNTADQAALALKNLFPTVLADEASPESERILRQVIVRFLRNEKYRSLVDGVEEWKSSLLAQLLELSEAFLLECGEDNADDVLLLFEAVSELAKRNPVLIPDAFGSAVLRILRGELQKEWGSADSEAGQRFLHQLETLLNQHPQDFDRLRVKSAPLLPPFRDRLRGSEDGENGA